jgi:hypothetical protein
MHRTAALTLAAILSFAGLQLAIAQEHHHGAEKTFVGHVVGLACYVSHGDIGEAHRQCAETCAKAGIPLAILDQQTGTLYLPLAKNHHEAANKELLAFAEGQALVEALLETHQQFDAFETPEAQVLVER